MFIKLHVIHKKEDIPQPILIILEHISAIVVDKDMTSIVRRSHGQSLDTIHVSEGVEEIEEILSKYNMVIGSPSSLLTLGN